VYGISAIAVDIPDGRLDNSGRADQLEFSREFLERKIGSVKVSRLEPRESTVDIATRVAEKLFGQSGLCPQSVDLIVLVTQTPCSGGIPHLSSRLHAALGLRSDAHFFDVSLGCSGWVNGLAIVKAYCEANGLNNAILVTADPYSRIIDPNDRNTVLLFGDGASATLVSRDFIFGIGRVVSLSDSSACNAISRGEGEFLSMNGRAVMEFARKAVPESIRRALTENQLTIPDIGCFYLHQGSRYIIEQLRATLGQTEISLPYVAAQYGNLVSSSIPVMVFNDWENVPPRSVVCGFGVGLTSVATVLTRTCT
jgi:3-oxoacyl-[acyl-carrier-protein] synthase-3